VLRAAIAASSNQSFRIVQFSVQDDHVHAIVEADDKSALSRGIAGFEIRAAKALNRALQRRGRVWSGKYHARALRTPHETRIGLIYVLQNWKKHVRGATGIDGCSSAPWFDGWTKTGRRPTAPSPVMAAQTWLAAKGWREQGGGPLRSEDGPASRSRKLDRPRIPGDQ